MRVQVSRVQSIERAFAVLAVLADGPAGVTEVAGRVALPKSTVARLLASLVREGAVEQLADDARYRLGPRMTELAARPLPTRALAEIARPHLSELAVAVGEVAGLAVRDGRLARYVAQVGTAHEVQVRDWTGSGVPLHAVPSGQVILAYLPSGALERFLDGPLESFTPFTLVDRDALLERLRQVRSDGVAWVRDEFAEGITSVAAPILGPRREIVAAIHVHGPSYRFPVAGTEVRMAEQVLRAAERVSAATLRDRS
jgi:DNA-binding IclR family transcriptional regulator